MFAITSSLNGTTIRGNGSVNIVVSPRDRSGTVASITIKGDSDTLQIGTKRPPAQLLGKERTLAQHAHDQRNRGRCSRLQATSSVTIVSTRCELCVRRKQQSGLGIEPMTSPLPRERSTEKFNEFRAILSRSPRFDAVRSGVAGAKPGRLLVRTFGA